MHTTSHTLLERLRGPGDAEAWRRLVRLYSPLLLVWGNRAGLQPSDAADLAQDVFAILLAKLPTFEYDAAGSFRCWLKAVTMNKLRDGRRRERVRAADSLEGVAEPLVEDPAEAFWEQEYRQVLLRNALELIRGEFSPAVWAQGTEFLFAEKSAREVAALHGTTENAVYIAKCRVQRRLREIVAGLME